jgi:hypothetical protein
MRGVLSKHGQHRSRRPRFRLGSINMEPQTFKGKVRPVGRVLEFPEFVFDESKPFRDPLAIWAHQDFQDTHAAWVLKSIAGNGGWFEHHDAAYKSSIKALEQQGLVTTGVEGGPVEDPFGGWDSPYLRYQTAQITPQGQKAAEEDPRSTKDLYLILSGEDEEEVDARAAQKAAERQAQLDQSDREYFSRQEAQWKQWEEGMAKTRSDIAASDKLRDKEDRLGKQRRDANWQRFKTAYGKIGSG